jgi:hypothetical protein
VSPKPTWATACASDVDYYNACQCFGITPTVITVTAPTPTSTVAGPACTEGVEYAWYDFANDAGRQNQIAEVYNDADWHLISVPSLVGHVTPLQTGVVSQVGFQEESNYYGPLQFSGVSAPANTNMQYNVLQYRGYLIPTTTGAYTVRFDVVDDMAVVLVGDAAVTGFDVNQALLGATWNSFNTDTKEATVNIADSDVGKALPFRILWANGGGPAGLLVSIVDPTGDVILGVGSSKNQQIVSRCDAGALGAPIWPAWDAEQ